MFGGLNNKNEAWINKLLEPAGIKINGNNPWDIKIINPDFYNRVKAQGSLGLGESYMDEFDPDHRIHDYIYRFYCATNC